VAAFAIAVKVCSSGASRLHVNGPAPTSSLDFRLIALGRILSMRD